MTDNAGLSRSLHRAETDRAPISPLTKDHPELTLDDAYAIQLGGIELRLEQGRRIVGHKVGLTSAAVQKQLGVDSPDYGHLLDDMDLSGPASVDLGRFLQPRIEPEIAFVLATDLQGPGIDRDGAAAAVEWVVPSLELVDSRIADWQITLLDTIADNASSAGFMIGSDRRRLDELDLERIECRLLVDGEEVGRGVGAAVLGHPLDALAWLANTLGERGVNLRTGDIVLPGALCAMVPARPGSTVTAEFDGLGTVTVKFAGADDEDGPR